jgi:uncharacterized protein (DUF2147 family)
MRMTYAAVLALVVAVGISGAYAREKAGIEGTWVTPEEKARIEIKKVKDYASISYHHGHDEEKARIEIKEVKGKYEGRIVWLKEPTYPEGDKDAGKPKQDRNNPDSAKRNKPILGLRILKGFVASGANTWTRGTIYDPENGKTYKCKITLVNPNTLNVRGYIGISLVGRTNVWTRYHEPEKEEGGEEGVSEVSKEEDL